VIVGSEGAIAWDFGDKVVKLFGSDGSVNEEFPEPDGWEMNQMYVDEIASFLESMEKGVESVCPLEQGVAALEVAVEVLEG
jgi:predicted dehydrogenase